MDLPERTRVWRKVDNRAKRTDVPLTKFDPEIELDPKWILLFNLLKKHAGQNGINTDHVQLRWQTPKSLKATCRLMFEYYIDDENEEYV